MKTGSLLGPEAEMYVTAEQQEKAELQWQASTPAQGTSGHSV